jgi:hypothetical protein
LIVLSGCSEKRQGIPESGPEPHRCLSNERMRGSGVDMKTRMIETLGEVGRAQDRWSWGQLVARSEPVG